MTTLTLTGVIGFVVIACVFGLVALKGRAGTLARGSGLGLHSAVLESSDDAWNTGHEAAWPIMAMACVVAVFHAVGCGLTSLMGNDGEAFLHVLLISGIIVSLALGTLARAAAINAAKRQAESDQAES